MQSIGVDCCASASICDMTGFDRVSFVITSVVCEFMLVTGLALRGNKIKSRKNKIKT